MIINKQVETGNNLLTHQVWKNKKNAIKSQHFKRQNKTKQ
jgi:hypothetical protein